MQPITYFFLSNDCLENVTICNFDGNIIATDCIILMQELQNAPCFFSQMKESCIKELCPVKNKNAQGKEVVSFIRNAHLISPIFNFPVHLYFL
jgi:hypothetical protein